MRTFSYLVITITLFSSLLGSAVVAQEKPAAPKPVSDQKSDAERIATLERELLESKKELESLESKIDPTNTETEFARAEAEFNLLNQQLIEKQEELKKQSAENPTADHGPLKAEIEELTKKRKAAQDRYDLAIKERKLLIEKKGDLEKRIAQHEQSLKKLKGLDQPKEPTPNKEPAIDPAQPATTPEVPKKESPPAKTVLPISPIPMPIPGKSEEKSDAGTVKEIPPRPVDERLERAKKFEQKKQQEVQEVQKSVQELEKELADHNKLIESDTGLLETAQQRARAAEKDLKSLEKELNSATGPERAPLREKIEETKARIDKAHKDARAIQEKISKAVEERKRYENDVEAAKRALKAKGQEKEQAADAVDNLQNPLNPENLVRWVKMYRKQILRIIGIIIGVWLLRFLIHRFSHHLVEFISKSKIRGTAQDRRNRADTLGAVFRNTGSLIVILMGIVMIFEQLGQDLSVVLGGAAVIGLAVAFGTQNLIKDYFTGFMILLEDQYGIGDVVRIGGTAGVVERITLRMTVLRDIEGIVHFIPHGTIDTVSNMTHGWSRALFTIGVAYKEDTDKVVEVLMELANGLRNDIKFGPLIIDAPEMLGVDAFGDSSVNIKFFIKTKPLMQWSVKRELNRRIKKKFDELGIEIPFPHRTVFHHHENAPPPDRLLEHVEKAAV